MRNIAIILITILITVVIGFFVYLLFGSRSELNPDSNLPQNSPTLRVIPIDSQQLYPEGWMSFRSDAIGVSLYHPPQMSVTQMEDGLVRLLVTGPSQVMGTEMYDGILVTLFKKPYQASNLREYVEFETEQKKSDPVYIEVSDIEEVRIGNTIAYAVVESTLEEFTQIYLPAGPNEYIQLTYIMEDPTNQGYGEMLNTLLQSIELEPSE